MYNRVVRGDFAHEVIQKMPALVVDELYRTSKMTPYVFVVMKTLTLPYRDLNPQPLGVLHP